MKAVARDRLIFLLILFTRVTFCADNGVDGTEELSGCRRLLQAVAETRTFSIAMEPIRHFFGPATIVTRALMRDRQNQRLPQDQQRRLTPLQMLLEGRFLIGYGILYSVLSPLSSQYATVILDDFDDELKELVKDDSPKRVLFISSFEDPKNHKIIGGKLAEAEFHAIRALHEKPKEQFEQWYKGHPNAEFKRVENLKELIAYLSSVKGERFDRIHISLHGSPKRVGFADGSIVTAEELRKAFREAKLDVAVKGAELIIDSCGTSGQAGVIEPHEDISVSLSEGILARGGTSFSSPRNIVINKRAEARALSAMVLLSGFGNMYKTMEILSAPTPLDGNERDIVHIIRVPAPVALPP